MFDVIRTLDPDNGLTRGWRMLPPSASDCPLWSVTIDIGGLQARGLTEPADALHAVGAYGLNRADTMVRAAGEAVERFALMPTGRGGPQARVGTAVEIGADGVDFAARSLGDPLAVEERLTWYQGTWLDSREPVWVPSGLVDYPIADPWFDPSPSGAAAGPDLDFALRGALLELIERDAVLVSWAGEGPLQAFDLDAELAAAPATANWQQLRRLRKLLAGQGLTPRLVRIPVLAGLHCALSAVVDERGFAAVGVKAHEDLGRALLVALQESLQVRELLGQLPPSPAPTVVRDDLDRARWWSTDLAVAELERRLHDLPTSPPSVAEAQPWTVPELVLAMRSDGGRPAYVDLTDRLPEAHRAMGWRAVKVIAPGYQPLRMNEQHGFGWLRDRITATSPERYFPHPLI